VVRTDFGKTVWWTFAGWKANLWLSAIATEAGCRDSVNYADDLTISLDPDADVARLREAVDEADLDKLVLASWITSDAIDGLKFAECLPVDRAIEVVTQRLADRDGVSIARAERIDSTVQHPQERSVS
jgi:ATP-dependent Lhr-like helicase